jgi:hypothetical protein
MELHETDSGDPEWACVSFRCPRAIADEISLLAADVGGVRSLVLGWMAQAGHSIATGPYPDRRRRGMRMDYLRTLPKSINPYQLLVHNSVRPTRRLGSRGFRAWLTPRSEIGRLEPCSCGWAPELGVHYRVKPRSGDLT